MNESFREHPSEEALERFVLKNSAEEELETVETHILACGFCVEQLELLETQIAATRLALQALEAQQASKRSADRSSRSRWKSWFTITRLSFAATGAVAAAAAILFSIPRDVSITAYRGAETAIVSQGRPLHMHLNAAGLDTGAITIELATNTGFVVWKGNSVIRHDSVDITLPRLIHSGPYLLRLYSPSTKAGTDPVLLREFALHAKGIL